MSTADLLLAPTAQPAPARRGRAVLLVLLVLALVALGVWQTWPRTSSLPLDPANPGPEGTRALVEVLRREGVDVEVVRTARDLEAADVGEATTLVVSASPMLSERGLDAAADRFAEAGSVRLLGLGSIALEQLGLPFERIPGTGDELDAACGVPSTATAPRIGPVSRVYARAGALDVWGSPVEEDTPEDGVHETGCYRTDDGAALLAVRTDDTAEAVPGLRDLQLFAPAELLTNSQVTRSDSAALGLRLLGPHERVVWYAPTSADVQEGDVTSRDARVVPPWLQPLVVLLAGTALLLMWWRGRRLGRLATEPMPVLVHASETTIARGRLYRRARGREHALDILRAATARRLRARLGLPRTASVETLVAAVAAASGRPADAVHDLLAGPNPTTDTQLAQVARDLLALEEGIRP